MTTASVSKIFRDSWAPKRITLLCLGTLLCALVFYLSGCSQPGETTAEGHRKHLRTLSLNRQEMEQDIDRFLLLDRPSRLTDKRIP